MKQVLLPVLFITCIAHSQTTPPLQWQHALGGTGEDNITHAWTDAGGASIMCGQSDSNNGDVSGNHGGNDGWIVKLDASGNIVWQKCYGGPGYDGIFGITATSDNGYIMVGYAGTNGGDVTGNHGSADGWVIKTDNWGIIQWKKCIGGSNTDVFDKVITTADNGYLLVGRSISNDGDLTTNKGMEDGWIVKLDASGNMLWQKTYGGTQGDFIVDAVPAGDGNYIFAGVSKSGDYDLPGNYGDFDTWFGKISSSDGTLIWSYQYGGSGADGALGLQLSSDNSTIVAAGYTYSPNDYNVTGNHGDVDGWLLALDATSGVLTTATCIGGSNSDYFVSIQPTYDKGFILAATTASDDGDVSYNTDITQGQLWVVKLNKNLGIDWEHTYGGPEYEGAIDAFEKSDGYFIASDTWGNGGDVSGYHGGGARDYWAVKLSNCFIPPVSCAVISALMPACGALTNLSVPGGPGYTYQWKRYGVVQSTTSGNTFIATQPGTYTCTVVNGACGSVNSPNSIVNKKQKAAITPTGTITKCAADPVNFSANGGAGLSYQWFKNNTAISGATSRTYTTTQAGRYRVQVTNAVTQCSNLSKTTSVTINCFAASADANNSELKTTNNSYLFNSPNPFSTSTIISYKIQVAYKKAYINITDFSGRVIRQIVLPGTQSGSINLSSQGLAAGTYLYSLMADNVIIKTQKLVVIK
ncbi:MAG TPA: T9SS type A sorting domain-containing protein [Panacibacter sp.]|nr:T9SS type A sorting domain-containing protein [Panacibacter sp.]